MVNDEYWRTALRTERFTHIAAALLLSLSLGACSNGSGSKDAVTPVNADPPKDGDPVITVNTCANGASDFPACVTFKSCGESKHGATEQRLRFQATSVAFGAECKNETQTRTCANGTFSEWSGGYTFGACAVAENPDKDFDSVVNDKDNCPTTPNTNQSDINNDGLGDVCDPNYLGQLSVILDD